MYSVYRHTCPNGKVYIGITKQKPERRWGNGGRGYKENEYFYRAIQKYGWDNIRHEIIAKGLTEDEAATMEIDLISRYRATDRSCGYNRHFGGKVHDTISIYELLNEDYIPYEQIKNNAILNDVFEKLIKSAFGIKYKETKIIDYYAKGKIVKTETLEITKEIKPSYFSICLLLKHYGETKKVKPLKSRLEKMKRDIEEEI